MKIFISHSSKDKEIVEPFIDLLTNALRINPDDIFCTSLDGHRISSGDNWRNSIKYNLAEAEIAFLIITDNYKKSEVCLNEMGAIYFSSEIQQVPLIIPPINNNSVGILYEVKQYENLLDTSSLERLKEILVDESKTKIKGDFWEKKKQKFIEDASIFSALNSDSLTDTFETDGKYCRGFHSELFADSVFSHHDKTSNIELIKQLSEELKSSNNERTIDLKYNYLGSTSAANWLTLSKHPNYGHSKLIDFFRDNSEEIIEKLNLTDGEKIDYISLGSGDGEIDKHIIFHLTKYNNLNVFYPFDISFELLQKVVNETSTCTWWQDKIKIKAIHGDFMELSHYKNLFDHDNVPNFFSLLGYTFGNYNESEFITKLKQGMRRGDFFLLDARLHDLPSIGDKISNDDKQKIISSYNNESINKFVFGALEVVTTAEYKSATFECIPKREITSVPSAVNILINCKGISAKFRSDNKPFKKENICLGLATLYSFEHLKEWLCSRGFQLIWSKSTAKNGFLLLRKTG